MAKLTKKKKVLETMTFDDDDKLSRKSIAENFNLLFEETTQPFVVALDSPWGTGKTQFIYMWRNLLDKEESVYLNLWEEDFLKNPFFSLTESLIPLFEKYKIDKIDTIKKDLAKVTKKLTRALIDKALNVDIDKFWKQNANVLMREEKIKFKEHLTKLSSEVRVKTGYPLLIFVDELDRCRPDYAVEFLEIVKHFFDIENIVFVLGIDANQLRHSVGSLYGVGMNAKEYLRKFIDISYSFPEVNLEKYLDFLFSEFDCGKKDASMIVVSKEIIKEFTPSLRQVDNLFTRLNLIEKNINDSYLDATLLLSLKIFEEEDYLKIINYNISVEGIFDLSKYFDQDASGIGKVSFWKLANELILRISYTDVQYNANLRKLFSFLSAKWHGIEDYVSKLSFYDNHFSMEPISKIFEEDKSIEQQKNRDIIKSLFKSKYHYLKGLNGLIQKIDFFDGLDFAKDNNSKE